LFIIGIIGSQFFKKVRGIRRIRGKRGEEESGKPEASGLALAKGATVVFWGLTEREKEGLMVVGGEKWGLYDCWWFVDR